MKFFLMMIAASISISGLISGCARKVDDGNLQVFYASQLDDVKTWDPANAYDSISLEYVPSIYETLYEYDYLAETYKLQPLLAADMPKFSADKKTVTIRLKHGIMFQDDPCFKATSGKGREMKAEDFIYEIKRLALPGIDSQGFWIFDGKMVGFNAFHDKLGKLTNQSEIKNAMASESIEGAKALDDYTLQLKFLKPYPQLQYVLAMSFTSPVPHEAIDAYQDEKGNLTDHAVGTGPFVLAMWNRSREIRLERNPHFHTDFYPTQGSEEYRAKGSLADAGKLLPFLDRIDINIVKEQQPQWLSFMKGSQDMITIPKDNFPQAIVNQVNLSPEMSAKGVRLDIESGVRFYYISFNMLDAILGKNKLLRQALASAVDREKWIEIFTNGTGKKATTALPPGIIDRPKDPVLKYDFDLTRAKDLLKKAGYPDGKGLPVINFDMRGADSVARQMGDFFTDQWGKIGVKLNVIYNTFPAYLEKAKKGNLQLSYGGWAMDYPDAENVYQLLYGPNKSPGPNETNFDNPEMNKLYEQLAIMTPGPEHAAVIKKADDLLQEEVPWALGYYATNYFLTQPWILNFRGNEIMTNKYKYLRVNIDVKRRYQDSAK
jgi:oligopeptide transport system substrate-binding protein